MSNSMIGALAMPRPRTGRAKSEVIEKPRARGGNTWAVGAYLKKLREIREVSQEHLIREILGKKGGRIIMSLSTLVQIENGNTKGSTASTIDAIRQAVGGSWDDLSDLYDLDMPSEDDTEGIKVARMEGESRAVARFKMLGGSPLDLVARNATTPQIEALLKSVASREDLIALNKLFINNPKALSIVQSVVKALDE